jgi:simple sugar transport system permease protein
MKRLREAGLELAVAAAAVLLALSVGGVVILAHGHNPFAVYGVLFREALGQPMGLGQVLFKTTTLVFTGIAASFAFRAGMFNIGGEGQLYAGGFLCGLVGFLLPAGTPAVVAVPVLLAAGVAGGAAAAVLPAALKAWRGTHEVISTMMMNFIVLAVANWGLNRVKVESTVHMPSIAPGGRLPLLSSIASAMRGSDGNVALFIAIAACAAAWYLYARTRLGYELRAVGYSPKAAEYGGVSVPSAMILSLVASGALAGLGGINTVMGSQGYFEEGFAPGMGYLGIAVALLARNHPIGVIPAAFLFALLSEGGQVIQQYVPKEIGDILQAVVIVFVVVGARLLQLALPKLRQRWAHV